MISFLELLVVGLIVIFLLVIAVGLILMIMHVMRLTQRVRDMEEQLKKTNGEQRTEDSN
jgi:cell division protein FtsL